MRFNHPHLISSSGALVATVFQSQKGSWFIPL